MGGAPANFPGQLLFGTGLGVSCFGVLIMLLEHVDEEVKKLWRAITKLSKKGGL